ncbi:MAG: Ribonuclease [Holophagaceae bacterium]|nr:Ribonuclease [Holophagaceae bacterium]
MVSPDLKTLSLALLLPAAIFAAPPVMAQSDGDQDDYAGESSDRYAQVRVMEGDAIIHKGDVEEALGRGTPVGEGDVVESRGRGVLQLGDGTRVAFDTGTRFTVAALFMDRQGERQVLLKLERGRLRISVSNDPDTRIRVDSPLGSVSFGVKANVAVGLGQQALETKVFTTRASVQNQEDKVTLGAGEWLRFHSPKDSLNRIRDFNTYDLDDFENWSGPQLAQRRVRDLDRVPEEIRPYAEELSGNGDWVYVDETQSYCWRPRGVPQDWRPYWRGRWASYPGGMTWVSDEPWGYVTHHYGRWGWSLSLGWYWIPGIQYSPAWVAWQNSDAYFGWAPLGYADQPCTWGYGEWRGGYCWNVVEINFISSPRIHHHMYPGWHHVRDFGPRNHGHRGSGPLTPPWRRTPLIVRPGEIRDPHQFRRVLQQRELRRERMQEYARRSEQATGRKVYRFTPERDHAPSNPGVSPQRPRVGFQDRERQWRRSERPEAARTPGGVVPPHRMQPRAPETDRPNNRVEPNQPRQIPGGVVPPHREQPRSGDLERPSRKVEPRQDPGGVVPPHREQPRSGDLERPSRQVEPRQDPGGVVPPRREQVKPQDGDRPVRRGEPEQSRREPSLNPRNTVEVPERRPAQVKEAPEKRPAQVKETPAPSKEKHSSRDRKEERSRENR